MSFFLGISGKYSSKEFEFIKNTFRENNILDNNSLLLGYNGIQETLKIKVIGKSGFILCGIGISPECEKLLEPNDWELILSQNQDNIKKLNGHFAGIVFNESEIKLFNDTFGLREIYYCKKKDALFFSTRLDILAKLINENEPDIKTLSSTWQLTNHFGYESLVQNINRLGPGGVILKNENNISITQTHAYKTEFANGVDAQCAISVLKNLTLLPIRGNSNLSLALSGGLDSRVLLTQLIENKQKFSVHTFGDDKQPDAIIAKRLSSYYKLEHMFFPNNIPPKEILVESLKSILGQTLLTMPASETLHMKNHGEVYKNGKFIIDGGYGEILRRELLNKVLLFEKEAILQNNFSKIIPLLRAHRADIFRDEIVMMMDEYLVDEIENACFQLPEPKLIGVEHWLDYFAIKRKMPNVNGPGQAAMDLLAPGYMPFAQKSLLDAGFLLSPAVKKNGKIFRSLISGSNLKLDKFPLVKNQIVYPYSSSSLKARLITRIKKQLGFVYNDPIRNNMLDLLKDYIVELINSEKIKNYALYDLKKISKIVDGYYSEKKTFAYELDWFLTFELWRQSLHN